MSANVVLDIITDWLLWAFPVIFPVLMSGRESED